VIGEKHYYAPSRVAVDGALRFMADVDNIVYLDCREHKDYELKRKPTSTCEACWKAWIHKRDYLRKQAEDSIRDIGR
jgi:hypothetical protein